MTHHLPRRLGRVIAAATFVAAFAAAAVAQSAGETAKPGAQPAAKAPQKATSPAKPGAGKPAQPEPAVATAPTPAAGGDTVLRSVTSRHELWTVACDHLAPPKPPRCIARLPVFASADMRQMLIMLSVAKPSEGATQLLIQLPTSILIAPGAELSFDGREARKLTIHSCEPALCTVNLPLDAAVRSELSGATTATMRWTSLITGAVRADFPLRGASAALEALLDK
ncbi:MAG: invasion associated locus B family protein [Rhodoblastus sp.]|nr:MAG: invasion associated locus B family protein [Rhodoblastus sp.]